MLRGDEGTASEVKCSRPGADSRSRWIRRLHSTCMFFGGGTFARPQATLLRLRIGADS